MARAKRDARVKYARCAEVNSASKPRNPYGEGTPSSLATQENYPKKALFA